MLNISRFDPFADIARLDPLGDDMLRTFAFRPVVRSAEVDSPMRLDVAEDETSYRVWAEIPGVKKEDIKVSIDGSQVSISAEMHKVEGNGLRFVRRERHSGTLTRNFSLAHDVNDREAHAKYSDGVLDLTLPKSAAGRVKSITVS